LARLAMALGAIGSGLAGVPNYAFEEMRDAIRNDLEAQKLNKAFLRDRAVAEGSIVQMARARFEDERMQDVAMQQSAWKLMDAELGRFAVMAKLPAQQAGIEAMRTQVFAELEDLDRQFRTANDAFVLRRLAAQQAAAAAQAKARADAMRTRREALEDETYVPNWGWARGKIEGRKMRQAQTDYYDAKQAFRELRGMARNWKTKVGTDTLGTGLFKGGTKEWAAARAAAARLQTKVAKAFGGVITDSDRAEAAKQVPDPTSMRDFNIDEALNAAERALDRNARAAIGSTIIGAPTDIIPTLPGDEPDVPLPQGQTETPAAGAAQSRGRGSAKTRQER
ncbi:MAG TPA: hypothetical protein VJ890_11000, partial [Vineibacter sp.]|nr:hypothetical protein [Vineibacter sp.]